MPNKWHICKEGKAGNNKLSQVKSLITSNAFCIVLRAIAQSKTGLFLVFVWLKPLRFSTTFQRLLQEQTRAAPVFQAGWSYCLYFFV
jgi:hypothetical protein